MAVAGRSTEWRAGSILALALAALSLPSHVGARPILRASGTLDQLIARLRQANRIDRASVERMTGLALKPSEGTGSFKFFESGEAKAGPLVLGVELREPIAGSGASAGPLLAVTVFRGCFRKAAVEARYAPWTLTDVPHGHSRDEKAYWSRQESWGELSFGFAERAPACLRTVVFDVKRRTAVSSEAAEPIGVATEEADGTIVLTPHAEGPRGMLSDAQFRYPPGDKDYEMVKAHVGLIPRGGSVPVKPFPER